jgi:hypothetical protein
LHWRNWFGLKPTESDFVQLLMRGRPDAESWAYDPKASTLSRDGVVVNLVNMRLEYSSAPRAARSALLEKYAATLSVETSTVSSLWTLAQTRIYPLVRSRFDRVTIDIRERRAQERLPARAARNFLGDLELIIGYDHGSSVSQVSVEQVAEWGISIDDALERAATTKKPTSKVGSLAQIS